MKQTLEEAARKYADEIYDPADRGILYRETQDDFIAVQNGMQSNPFG